MPKCEYRDLRVQGENNSEAHIKALNTDAAISLAQQLCKYTTCRGVDVWDIHTRMMHSHYYGQNIPDFPVQDD